MNQKITRIRRKLMAELDKERYEHTLGVMYTAASMAMRYDADIDKALWQDCSMTAPNVYPARTRSSSATDTI